jgi:predicted nucleotidyltransferase
LNSPVLEWPTTAEARDAFRSWADRLLREEEGVRRAGYFGSLARGDWGVGSDLDVLVLVEEADRPFFERPSQFDTSPLPVPVDLLVYTEAEWRTLVEEKRGPARGPVVWAREDDG